MLTWRPIPDAENLTVDHLDHNKRNNTVYNLEWVTLEENRTRAQEDLYIEPAAAAKKTPAQAKASTPAQPHIKAGSLTFNSVDEAALWCVSEIGNGLTFEQAKSKIEIKLVSGAKYCGRKWRWVV